jgi:hypothetical protein
VHKTGLCKEVCCVVMDLFERINDEHCSSVPVAEYQNRCILCAEYVVKSILKEAMILILVTAYCILLRFLTSAHARFNKTVLNWKNLEL